MKNSPQSHLDLSPYLSANVILLSPKAGKDDTGESAKVTENLNFPSSLKGDRAILRGNQGARLLLSHCNARERGITDWMTISQLRLIVHHQGRANTPMQGEGEKRLAQKSDCSRWTLRAKSKIHRDRNLTVSRENYRAALRGSSKDV